MVLFIIKRRLRPALPVWALRSLWIVLSLGALTLAAVVIWNGPVWFDSTLLANIGDAEKKAQAVSSTRTTLLQMFLSFGGLATVVFSARTYLLSRSGQVADRYAKATSQLVSDNPAERIGAIYSLARLLKDSPRDHRAIVDLLAAFVRHSRALGAEALDDGGLVEDDECESGLSWKGDHFPIDVQSVIDVLVKRPKRFETPWILIGRADLAGARFTNGWIDTIHFEGCNLRGAHFVHAKATSVVLSECDLRATNLSGAQLPFAHMQDSDLRGALVRWVNLRGAGLMRTDFRGAVLRGSDLRGAALADADLRGVDLSEVNGLSAGQIAEAVTDGETVLPPYLTSRPADGGAKGDVPHPEGSPPAA
ncbi:hypothetical protein GCM10023193_01110 [Planotetraspora kaengkrachanensis]|uniref:Pentapeptide repeat-containing protein n=1 Tax=Planotetraspora kaengkrachanensis TaxID=575193 RepID=A0A8J3PRM5_9ACTN|nr:hypothetical protein Pka01_04480 [Planotetraspora kaengkrachanensis]